MTPGRGLLAAAEATNRVLGGNFEAIAQVRERPTVGTGSDLHTRGSCSSSSGLPKNPAGGRQGKAAWAPVTSPLTWLPCSLQRGGLISPPRSELLSILTMCFPWGLLVTGRGRQHPRSPCGARRSMAQHSFWVLVVFSSQAGELNVFSFITHVWRRDHPSVRGGDREVGAPFHHGSQTFQPPPCERHLASDSHVTWQALGGRGQR